MFDTFIGAKYDEFISKFTTSRGKFRKAIRVLRKEIGEQEKARAALEQYVKHLQGQQPEKVLEALCLKHGYFVLLEEQMNGLFEVLHRILQEDNDLLNGLQALIRDVHSAPDLPADVTRIVVKSLNDSLKEVEKGLNKMLQDLAGIESTTLSSFKLLERESQVREIIAELKKGVNAFRSYKKVQKLASSELHEFRKKFVMDKFRLSAPFDYEHPDKSLQGQMQNLVRELMTITDEVAMLLNGVHTEFQQMKDATVGSGTPLGAVAPEHAPSVRVLSTPVAAGGFGYPKNFEERLQQRMREIEDSYKRELHKIIAESRLFISKAEHSMA